MNPLTPQAHGTENDDKLYRLGANFKGHLKTFPVFP